jgi:fumarate reductase flavoprotein subunit
MDEQKRLETRYLRKADGKERIAAIREEMQSAIEKGAGIFREESTLAESVDTMRELQERFNNIALDDKSHTFNTELELALELGYMLDVAECIVNSAAQRKESRGAHQRTDFPARDDVRYLAHSLIRRKSDHSLSVEYLPVKITRWPPGERVYGQQSSEAKAASSVHAKGGM